MLCSSLKIRFFMMAKKNVRYEESRSTTSDRALTAQDRRTLFLCAPLPSMVFFQYGRVRLRGYYTTPLLTRNEKKFHSRSIFPSQFHLFLQKSFLRYLISIFFRDRLNLLFFSIRIVPFTINRSFVRYPDEHNLSSAIHFLLVSIVR